MVWSVVKSTWIAHIHDKSGEIREIKFSSERGNKDVALTKALTHAGLANTDDPTIKGIKLLEEGATKEYKYGRELHLNNDSPQVASMEEARKTKRDRSNDKRYRVRMYPSPASANYQQRVVQTVSPYEAFLAVLAMCHTDTNKVGPYVVEECVGHNALTDMDVWETRMCKHVDAFDNAKPPPATQLKPENLGMRTAKKTHYGWTYDYEFEDVRETKRNTTVSDIISILSQEKAVDKTVYTVKRS